LNRFLEILSFFGGGLCHQRIDRTFTIESLNMPVCSRCTGIYLGILLSFLALVLIERKIKGEFPSLKMVLVSVGVFLLMGADVVLSALGLIQSNNVIRMITGFMTGWFMVFLLLPLAASSMFKRSVRKHYLDDWKKFLTWLAAGAAGAMLFLFTYRYAIIFWAVLAILGLIAFVTLILFILFFSLNRRLLGSIDSRGRFLAAIAAGALSSIALLTLFSYLRRFLV